VRAGRVGGRAVKLVGQDGAEQVEDVTSRTPARVSTLSSTPATWTRNGRISAASPVRPDIRVAVSPATRSSGRPSRSRGKTSTSVRWLSSKASE
jgi:hypothetical protein